MDEVAKEGVALLGARVDEMEGQETVIAEEVVVGAAITIEAKAETETETEAEAKAETKAGEEAEEGLLAVRAVRVNTVRVTVTVV